MNARHLLLIAALLGAAAGSVWAAVDTGIPATRQLSALSMPAAQREQVEKSAYYRNCAEARTAGAAPMYQGQPGYRSALDADGDGIACEPYKGSD